MKGKILDKEGNLQGEIELPIEEALAHLASPSSDSEAELAEAKGEVTRLNDRIAELESEEHNQAILKDYFGRMTPDLYLEVGKKLGYDIEFCKASEAEVAQATEEEKDETEPEVEKETESEAEVASPKEYEWRDGKIEEEGWDYHPLYNKSSREIPK